MDFVALLFIAFGLAMDAFAVSVASGTTIRNMKTSHALRMAVFFGSFQAFMPVIGWLTGLTLIVFISGIDHWVAFGLLVFIGCKMIYESISLDSSNRAKEDPLNIRILLLLSAATSIDALVVGISFAFLKVSIATPILVIGTTTFLLSLIGATLGKRLGHLFENRIEIVGGLVLIGIGVKILLEHLV